MATVYIDRNQIMLLLQDKSEEQQQKICALT